MKLTTVTLVVSLLAFASLGQAQNPEWDKWIKCGRVGTRMIAGVLRGFVPELRIFLNCIDYSPPLHPKNVIGNIKIIYEFIKRSVFERSSCILEPLRRGVEVLRPSIKQVDALQCFD